MRFRYGIVVPQLSLSLVLLLVAGVYLQDLLRIERNDLGFDKHGSFIVRFWMRGRPVERMPQPGRTADQALAAEQHAARTREFYRNLMQRFETMPALAGASLSTSLPTDYGSWRAFPVFSEDGSAAEQRATDRAAVSPGYFDVMGIRVLGGRGFDERDTPASRRVALVSARLAQTLWRDQTAIGRLIALDRDAAARREWLEVVGIVSDVAPVLQELGENPFVYLPLSQQWRMDAGMVVARPAGGRAEAIAAVRDAIESADIGTTITQVRTIEQTVGEILYPRRLAAAILTACSALGIALACVGLYGVVAYSIAQRQREIGIRAALGAERRDIMRLVVGEGLAVLVAGSMAGAVLAGLALPAVASLVIAVPGPGVPLMAAVAALLATVVLVACSLPARRASRMNPADVLRSQ